MQYPDGVEKLLSFYNAKDEWELIERMSHHIDKLQAKVQALAVQDVARRIVREG